MFVVSSCSCLWPIHWSQVLRRQSTYGLTHFECLYLYLDDIRICISLLCSQQLQNTYDNFFRSKFQLCDIVLALLVKPLFLIFCIQIYKCDAWFQFLFSGMVLLYVAPESVPCFPIYFTVFEISHFLQKSNCLQRISFITLGHDANWISTSPRTALK